MKTKVQIFLVALMAVNAVHHTAAQGTVFTYQGQLIQGTNPATGGYDMTFSLYPASVGGNSLAGPVTNLAVAVANGLFTVPVDFGAEVFNGGSYWLGIAVRTNGGGAFTTLAPRTPVTPTPYAIYSQMGGSATNFTGSVSGDISGTQDALVVTTVGGQTAASIAQGVVAANNATPSSVPNSIVERDTNGNFSANALTLGGALNLPYPAILSSGGSNFLMEEGSLYMGLESAPFAPQGDLNNTGYGDYALGTEATTRRVIGNQNTAVGEYALYANTNGSKNTAVGVDALGTNTSGSLNTAVGVDALSGNTFGSQNTAVGEGALQSNNGFENTAVGFAAMGSGNYPSSSGNTANGAEALLQNETGTNNTAIGLDALVNNWGGCNNTADGAQALGGNWNGSDSTAVGYNALANAGNDSRAVAVGESALMNDNSYGYYSTNSGISQNTAVGYQALEQNNSGTQNTAEGYQSLLSNTNGSQNTAVGVYALQNNTSGGGNTAVGVYALLNNTSGSGNTADGVQSLFNNASGSYNTADGEYSLYYDSSGSLNTAVGYGALSESGSGAYNIAIGFNAGSSLSHRQQQYLHRQSGRGWRQRCHPHWQRPDHHGHRRHL